jgi:hypothetical protein
MQQTEEPKEGELCCGFSWGGGSVVRSASVREGTRHCVKKKEKDKGSGELNLSEPIPTATDDDRQHGASANGK